MNDPITGKIIGAAYKVYNTLGFGFLESVYEKSMLIELTKQGLKAESQYSIKVFYEDNPVGDFLADLLVEESVIIELKSAKNSFKSTKYNS